MDRKERSEITKALKLDPLYKKFMELLRHEEASLRLTYESQPASEYNRGKLNGVQFVINNLLGE